MSHGEEAATQEPDPGSWGRYVREVLARPGWNISRLARESGVSQSSIFRWLNGQTTNVTADSIRRVAAAVGDNPDEALLRAADTGLVDDPLGINRQPGESVDDWVRRQLRELWENPIYPAEARDELERRILEAADRIRAADAGLSVLEARRRYFQERPPA